MSGCGVGDTGAKEIANALQACLHLETLCLGHNAIGDDGASALTRAVAENRALRRYVPFHADYQLLVFSFIFEYHVTLEIGDNRVDGG